VNRPPLPRALAVSAAVHLLALAAVALWAGPPRGPAPLRVFLAEVPGGAAPGPREVPEPAPSGPAPTAAHRQPVPPSPGGPRRAWRRSAAASPAPEPGPGEPPALSRLTPVQDDVWLLPGTRISPGPSTSPERTGMEQGEPSSGAPGSAGRAAGFPGPGAGSGTGGSSGASVLELLSRRLAWSAERCAPPAPVRRTRHGVPGVPLHFCLDSAGRPRDVGLLGTTGSDLLDRAARDCVVPGAVPLPPAPGCYTVEVRFPTRG